MEVASGQADATAALSNVLEVQASDHAIIHWDQFSIGSSEIVKFVLPDATSAVLNRVTGGASSEIMGLLQSNGQVYLVNPQGIVIGKDAMIDTASFIASTFDLFNEDFLAKGDLLFQGDSSASIVNLGTIRTSVGDCALLARHVQNFGTIEALSGTASMAAGRQILLKPEDSRRVYIQVSDGASLVENQGTIRALVVELEADGLLYGQAVCHSGLVDALGVKREDGRILLVAEGGRVDVTADGDMTLSGCLSNESGSILNLVCLGDLTVNGQIGSQKRNGGRINVTANNLFLEEGAQIGHRGTTQTAPIYVRAENSLQMDGAQIGHGVLAGSNILSGDIAISTGQNVEMQNAIIGHGPTLDGVIYPGFTISVIAGLNIEMEGTAQIINQSGTLANAITLVCDHNSPVFPEYGVGSFHCGKDALLQSSLAAQVRVYTSAKVFNTPPLGDEVWGTYYDPREAPGGGGIVQGSSICTYYKRIGGLSIGNLRQTDGVVLGSPTIFPPNTPEVYLLASAIEKALESGDVTIDAESIQMGALHSSASILTLSASNDILIQGPVQGKISLNAGRDLVLKRGGLEGALAVNVGRDVVQLKGNLLASSLTVGRDLTSSAVISAPNIAVGRDLLQRASIMASNVMVGGEHWLRGADAALTTHTHVVDGGMRLTRGAHIAGEMSLLIGHGNFVLERGTEIQSQNFKLAVPNGSFLMNGNIEGQATLQVGGDLRMDSAVILSTPLAIAVLGDVWMKDSVVSSQEMTLEVAGDLSVQGGIYRANTLTANVGGKLHLTQGSIEAGKVAVFAQDSIFLGEASASANEISLQAGRNVILNASDLVGDSIVIVTDSETGFFSMSEDSSIVAADANIYTAAHLFNTLGCKTQELPFKIHYKRFGGLLIAEGPDEGAIYQNGTYLLTSLQARISVAQLSKHLEAGDVTIDTGGNSVLIRDAISWASPTTLTIASQDIALNGSITGDIHLQAARSVFMEGANVSGDVRFDIGGEWRARNSFFTASKFHAAIAKGASFVDSGIESRGSLAIDVAGGMVARHTNLGSLNSTTSIHAGKDISLYASVVGSTAGSSGAIVVSCGGNLLAEAHNNQWAVIGHGSPLTANCETIHAPIIISAGGRVTLRGEIAGELSDQYGFAQIGHQMGVPACSSISGDISVIAGDLLTVQGGTFPHSEALIGHGILHTGSGSLTISAREATVLGAAKIFASGNSALNMQVGDLAMRGSEISSEQGPCAIDVRGDMVLDGSAIGSIGGEMTVSCAGSLRMESSFIGPTALGQLTVTVGDDCTMNSGVSSFSQIGCASLSSTSIFFNVGGHLFMTAEGVGYTLVGNGRVNAPSGVNASDIAVTVGGNIVLNGAAKAYGGFGFAQIGHLNSQSANTAIAGDIRVVAGGDVFLNPGFKATAFTRIGSGGIAKIAGPLSLDTYGNGTIRVIANGSIVLNTNPLPEVAQVVNLCRGNIWLIAEGSTGYFSFSPTNGFINAASGFQVKIYSSARVFNALPAGSIINGQSYEPAPLPTNALPQLANAEAWGYSYESDLTNPYVGPNFNIYYKRIGGILLSSDPTTLGVAVVDGHYQLGANREVVINTGDLSDQLALHSITIDAPHNSIVFRNGELAWTSPSSLTIRAPEDLEIYSVVRGSGNISLSVGGDLTLLGGSIYADEMSIDVSRDLTLTSGSTIGGTTTKLIVGGDLTLNAGNIESKRDLLIQNIGGDLTLNANRNNKATIGGGGNITIQNVAGSVALNAYNGHQAQIGSSSSANIVVAAIGSITLNGGSSESAFAMIGNSDHAPGDLTIISTSSNLILNSHQGSAILQTSGNGQLTTIIAGDTILNGASIVRSEDGMITMVIGGVQMFSKDSEVSNTSADGISILADTISLALRETDSESDSSTISSSGPVHLYSAIEQIDLILGEVASEDALFGPLDLNAIISLWFQYYPDATEEFPFPLTVFIQNPLQVMMHDVMTTSSNMPHFIPRAAPVLQEPGFKKDDSVDEAESS